NGPQSRVNPQAALARKQRQPADGPALILCAQTRWHHFHEARISGMMDARNLLKSSPSLGLHSYQPELAVAGAGKELRVHKCGKGCVPRLGINTEQTL